MRKLLERLADGELLVGDGALGTLLMEGGALRQGECPERLNLTRPEVLRDIALLYRAAGADLLQTNTFGATSCKLAAYGLGDQTREINRKAVEAVREAAGGQVYVSASCGPTGRILQPYGDAEPEAVRAAFEEQMSALAEAGADVLCIETMSDVEEAKLAVRAAKSAAPGLPVIATMTFEKTKKGWRTMMGVSVAQAVHELTEAGADVLGANCGSGMDNMLQIAAEFGAATRRPLLFQPNAGLPELRNGKAVYRESPEFMAARVDALIAVGASLIGGCCGTTPKHILALSQRRAARAAKGS